MNKPIMKTFCLTISVHRFGYPLGRQNKHYLIKSWYVNYNPRKEGFRPYRTPVYVDLD